MPPRLRRLAALGLTALCLWSSAARPARAGTPLPGNQTIDTPHFRLHAPIGLEAVAFRAARICEEAHGVLAPLLRHWPSERTEVSITDFGDSANGSATALPANRITLLAAPPAIDGNLGDYDDWLRQLIYHEYTHILHLDTVHGVPAALNHVFGKRFAPNQNMPAFVIEGTAVYVESLTSGRGRVRSAMFRGWLRTAALADTLHDVDVVTHYPRTFPSANVWYMYGGHFMDWVARKLGPDVIGRMFAAYGHDLIPFAINRASQEATGRPLTELWSEWQADLRAEAQAEAGRRGFTDADVGRTTPFPLTHTGNRHENPRFLPDGRLLSTEADPDLEADIYDRGPTGTQSPRTHLHLDGTERWDVCRQTGALVFDQVDIHAGAFAYTDLHVWDGAHERRVTRAARVRDPGCAPDGRWAAGVQILEGRTRLVRVDLTDGRIDPLWDPGGLDQVAHPSVSPDGQTIAFIVTQAGRRDVATLRLAPGGPVFAWRTADDALELRPRFTPDGAELLYASDRSGVFELYQGPLTGGAPDRRLTNSIGGVIEADYRPDGAALAAIVLTAEGQDLAWFDAPAGRDFGHALDLPPGRAPRPDVGDRPLPTSPYTPFESLWPTVWAPKIAVSSPESNADQFGLTVDGTDALGHHALLADFTTRPEAGGYAARFAWGYRRHTPNFGLSGSHETRVRDGGQFYADTRHPLRENVTTAAASVGLGVSRSGHAGSIAARYSGAWFTPAENPAPTLDPLDTPPFFGEPSRTTDLTLSLRYRNVGRRMEAISDTDGFALGATLRLRDELIGSRAQTAEAFLDYQHYVGLWWHHVLALRLSGAFGAGDDRQGVYYALGPAPERNVLLDALDQIAFGSTFLRGFPAATARGSRYVLATAEYRVPVFSLFRGFSMVPVFLRNLDLALFSDWAQARDTGLRIYPDSFYKSAGVELVARALLGWRLPMDTRLGYARGFGDAGEDQLYFFLGNWF
jgi:hypothetical protein